MTICTVCPDKPGHGWKESGVTHCRTCHTTWARGNKYMHCVTCHETFSTPANCDRHQVGSKADPGWRCRPPELVGLIASERTIGSHALTVWHMPGMERIDLRLDDGEAP